MREKTELIEEIIRLQRQMGHVMGHYTPQPWMDLSLTIGQLKSLFYIDFKGSTNTRNLATALGVTPPNVTGIIDRMVEQGLVSRDDNPENRRELLLRTTDKGKDLLAKLRESGMSRASGVLAQLSMEELSALAQGLSAFAKAAGQGEEKNIDECNRS